MSPSPSSAGLPVIVVGSGAAGLAAAFRLKQAGLRPRLLEAAPVIGGKLRSKQRDGFLIDQGAFFIPSTHRRMVALAAEAGFADQLFAGGSVMAVARGGLIHEVDINHAMRDLFRTRLFSTGTKLRLTRLIGEFRRSRSAGFERLPEVAALDAETADTWARRELGEEMAEYVVGLVLRGMSGASAEGSSRVEWLALLTLLAKARLLACRGGMGAYAANLATGIDVQVGAQVREVRKQGDGVRVSWTDAAGVEHVELAAGCVVAGSAETAVEVLPDLDVWRRQYLSSVRDRRVFIVNIALARPPAGLKATYVLVPRAVNQGICGICSDHYKAPGRVPSGKGLLSLMPLHDWAEQRYGDDDDRIVRDSLQALDTVVPGAARDVEFAEVSRWTQRYNPIGHYHDLGRFRHVCETADGLIQLAGDYYGYAQIDTAMRSGERAAHALAQALRSQP